jgi:hypothetical protein
MHKGDFSMWLAAIKIVLASHIIKGNRHCTGTHIGLPGQKNWLSFRLSFDISGVF